MDIGPKLTVDAGLQLVTRQPHRCSELLAESIYPFLEGEAWFTKEWRLRFFAYLLENIVDQSAESGVDLKVLNRVKRLPMSKAVKFIGAGPPESGLKALVALICMELRINQKLDVEQQYVFYNVLFKKLFPENTAVEQRTASRRPRLEAAPQVVPNYRL